MILKQSGNFIASCIVNYIVTNVMVKPGPTYSHDVKRSQTIWSVSFIDCSPKVKRYKFKNTKLKSKINIFMGPKKSNNVTCE